MYKIAIVDDELLVQVGIKSMLDWEKENIEIVGMASNGEQAYELIITKQPDIVITDIKMPVMDGFTLIKKCREYLDFVPQFILLTSHEDFHYAKEAISLQAVDYLIKLDLNMDSLKNAINTAKNRLKVQTVQEITTSHGLSPKELIEKLFKNATNNFIDGKDLRSEIAKIDSYLCDNLYILCFSITMKNRSNMIKSEEERICQCVENTCFEVVNKIHYGYVIPIDSYQFLMIVTAKDTKSSALIKLRVTEMIERMIQVNAQYFNVDLKIGCSNFQHPIEELFTAYTEARKGLVYNKKENSYIFFDEVENILKTQKSFDITLFSKEIMSCYEKGDAEGVHSIFQNMTDLFRESEPRVEQMQDCCNKLLYFVLTSMEGGEKIVSITTKSEESGFHYINGLQNVVDFMDWMTALSKSICAELSLENKNYSNRLVLETKGYIKDHIEDKLQLSEVASYLDLNASYLSLIFKKYAGVGFNDYVSKKKMDYAKDLLCSKNVKIYEVAEKLGYENAYYFSKVFKKYNAITPKEYISRYQIRGI